MPLSRDEILRRAAKLTQFQHGNATQAELENAAARLGELLRENNLTMSDVTAAAMKDDIESVEGVTGYTATPGWYLRLATQIAHAIGCRWLHRRFSAAAVLAFVGCSADARVASYFMDVCAGELPKMARRAKPYDRRAYLFGVADGIGRRLREMITPVDMSSGERGLIVAKSAAVDAFMADHHANARRQRPGKPIDDRGSYEQGRQDAERIALNHAIADSVTDAPRIAQS